MKRSEVRALLEEGINKIREAISFKVGRISEFNNEQDKDFPYAWVSQLRRGTELRTNSFPINTWAIIIRVAKIDTMDSAPKQYECIVDDCDYLAQQFIKKYNQDVEGSKLLQIQGINTTPFYKEGSDPTTGVDLTFNLVDPDTTPLCA